MSKLLVIAIFIVQAFTVFAQSPLDSLKYELKSCEHDSCRVRSLMNLAYNYHKSKEIDSVESCFDQILLIGNQSVKNSVIDTIFIISLYEESKSIAKYYFNYKDDFRMSIVFFELAVKLCKLIHNNACLANSYKWIGINYELLGDYEIAIFNVRKSIDLYLMEGDSTNAAYSLIEVANIYSNWSQPLRAKENYKKCLDICLLCEDSAGISASYIGLGNILIDQGKYDEALDYYNKSLALEHLLNGNEGIVLALSSIASIYLKKDNYELALDYSFKALKLSRKSDLKYRISLVLSQVGDLYIKLNDFYNSEKYLLESLSLSQELEFKKIEQKALKSLSDLYIEMKDYKKAYDYSKLYHLTKDSIFNAEKFKELSTLEIKYETAEKNKKILLQKNEIETSNLKLHQERIIRNIFIVGILVALLFSVYIYTIYRQKKRANALLAKQRNEIEKQRDSIHYQKSVIEKIHKQVSESIDYATRLQRSILPDESVLIEYFQDYLVIFMPKDKVSGDFFWWHRTKNNTIITAADCTGHGVPGAFMSMLGVTFLREIIIKNGELCPNIILKQLRNEIITALDQSGKVGEQKDGMDMALININHSSRLLQYSGAYNPLYIIRKEGLNNIILKDRGELTAVSIYNSFSLYELKADKMPIGIYQRMDDFNLHEIKLEKGDRIFMFSDGYADQFGGPKEKKFKYNSFRKVLLESAGQNMNQQKAALELAFSQWKGDVDQVDDIVVLGIEIA
ncbi:MAG: tetratricopeptide repeat protein [Bacteroidales bacterium]|nr:tetratricopeptide repeat protein [Bacteroidales bacterium]